MKSAEEFIKRKEEAFGDGDEVSFPDISRNGFRIYKREKWTFMPQSNLDKKVFLIERLKIIRIEGEVTYPSSVKIGDVEYRISYFIVGKIGNKEGVWTFGQRPLLIPPDDLKKLVNKAKNEGTILE